MYKIISFRYESVIQKIFAPPITNLFLRPCRRQQDDGLILRDQMKFGLPINALSSICFSSWDIPYTSVAVVGFSMDLLYMKSNEKIRLGDPF